MNKLKLQIDNLKVDSFETAEAGRERRGTVQGASGLPPRDPTLGCEFITRLTGPCCDYTLAPSCMETYCQCQVSDGGTCFC